MRFNLYNSLMLAGGIQGIIFVLAVLTSKKYKSSSTNYLMALIFVFSVNILQYYLNDTKLVSSFFFFRYLYIPFSSLSVVFLFFYILKLLYPERKISGKLKLFYLPFLFFFTISLIFKISCLFINPLHIGEFESVFWSVYQFQEVFSLVYTLIFLVLGIRMIHRYEKKENPGNEVHSKMHLDWLKYTLYFFVFILLGIWLWLTYLDIFVAEPEFYLLWIGMSASIYWLGHIGIYQFGLGKERKEIRKYTAKLTPEPPVRSEGQKKSKHLENFEDYVVNQRNFMDPLLSLEKSAEHLGVNKTYLSRVLNRELSISFNDYVNQLRVEEAKKILQQPEFSNYTLSAIGLEAGFNSKSTFYSAFKKFAEMSPSDYRNQKNLPADS